VKERAGGCSVRGGVEPTIIMKLTSLHKKIAFCTKKGGDKDALRVRGIMEE